jgi:hypothetical protein
MTINFQDEYKTATQAGADFEGHAWRLARERFQENHRKSDPRRLQEFLKDHISIEKAKDACNAAQNNASKEYSPAIGGILEKIDVAMRMGDLAMKAAPESVGLAWAGVRLCMHAINDDFATVSLFSNACSDILGILISCGAYGKMYSAPKGPDSFRELHAQVIDYIPTIYVDILEFSYAMKKQMTRSQSTRLIKGTFYSYESKFKLLIQNITAGERKMRDYATQATDRLTIFYQEETLKGQGTMSAQLGEVLDSLRLSVKMNNEFAEKLRQYEEERKTMKKKSPGELAKEAFEANRKVLATATDHQTAAFIAKKERRTPNTCTWIFDHEAYMEWLSSETSSVLWLSGGGGERSSATFSPLQLTIFRFREIYHRIRCHRKPPKAGA